PPVTICGSYGRTILPPFACIGHPALPGRNTKALAKLPPDNPGCRGGDYKDQKKNRCFLLDGVARCFHAHVEIHCSSYNQSGKKINVAVAVPEEPPMARPAKAQITSKRNPAPMTMSVCILVLPRLGGLPDVQSLDLSGS